MTILLTGATGFLGSSLLKKFLQNEFNVIALKRKESDSTRIIKELELVTFYNSDECDLADIFKTHKIDLVINTVTDYGRTNKKVSSILATNLMFGLKLLELSMDHNVGIFINTDTSLDRNINPYALSKAQLVDWMKYLENKNTKIINIKIEHMYGPKDDKMKFVTWLIEQLKQNVPSIDLTSGIQKRDFIYIDDIIEAYMTIIQHSDLIPQFEEFELGSGYSIEVKEFVNTIDQQISKSHPTSTQLNFGAIAYRSHEQMNMCANISKLQALGWEPKVSILEGIKNTIQKSSM